MVNQFTSQSVIQELLNAKSHTGGTSLITLYVPGNTNMNIVTQQLNSELATSQNIKSKQVRTSVQSAIKSGLQQIKLLPPKVPENGFVMCAGELKSYI